MRGAVDKFSIDYARKGKRFMAISPEQMFLISEMKKMGIDRETTAIVTSHLKTKEQIRSMWSWMHSLQVIPSGSQIIEKLVQIISEK